MSKFDSPAEIHGFLTSFLDIDQSRIKVIDDGYELEIEIEGKDGITEERIGGAVEILRNHIPTPVELSVKQDPQPIPELWRDEVEPSTPDFGFDLNSSEETIEMMEEAVSDIDLERTREALQGVATTMSGLSDLKLQPGDKVVVTNTDGNQVKGEVKKKFDKTAGEYRTGAEDGTLVDYWDQRGYNINPDEGVFLVDIDGGGSYSYPGSKVEPAEDNITVVSGVGNAKADALRESGYDTVQKLRAASQQELAEIEGIGNALAARIKADLGTTESADEMTHVGYECPYCGDAFTDQSSEAIEGDEGSMYCSLECLNEDIA